VWCALNLRQMALFDVVQALAVYQDLLVSP